MPTHATALLASAAVAFAVSATVVWMLLKTRAGRLALDEPNARSLHATPVPRLGGIGIVGGVIAAWLYAAPGIDPRLAVALVLLIGVSLLDDLRGVGVSWRLTVHLASAALAVTTALQGHELWLMAVAVLVTAWMINLYNFMDGSDGLAGGMAVSGFGSYGIAALMGGDWSLAAINLSVASAALGFLLFNFPPAKVFMGDVGAIPLGCLAAVFNVTGWLRGDWPVWFGFAVFSPFIVDASLTLLKRQLRGARVWQAHREHYYQRLVQSGWGHRKTALAEYALMLACSGLAIAGMRQQPFLQLAALGALTLLYTGLVVALERYFSRHG